MAAGTLYTYPENFRAWKIQVAAEYSGFNLTVDAGFKYGETDCTDEFQTKFPLGKVPAFESADGVCLNESNAIAAFVANDALTGVSKEDRCRVAQWVGFAESEILPNICTWIFPCQGIMQFNKQNTERAKEELKHVFHVLNHHLATRTFLVGERVTLADLSVASYLLLGYQLVFDPSYRSASQNVTRWFETVVNQPQFKKVVPEVKLCEKMAQFDAKKYAEVSGTSKKSKGAEKKKDTPKKQEKKVEKKPEPADDEPPAEPKKAKDPFLQFPASETFIFDEWKKMYSNNPYDMSIPWFFEKFDAEKCTIWKGEYNYNSDLTGPLFMSKNLMGGMIQRLDGLRKHGFGSHFLFKLPDDSRQLSAVYICRGPKLPFEVDDSLNVDAESYTWTQLDFNNKEHREIITEYWKADDANMGDKEVAHNLIFK